MWERRMEELGVNDFFSFLNDREDRSSQENSAALPNSSFSVLSRAEENRYDRRGIKTLLDWFSDFYWSQCLRRDVIFTCRAESGSKGSLQPVAINQTDRCCTAPMLSFRSGRVCASSDGFPRYAGSVVVSNATSNRVKRKVFVLVVNNSHGGQDGWKEQRKTKDNVTTAMAMI